MNKKTEKIFIVTADFLTLNFAWVIFFYFKVETGWFNTITQPIFLAPMLAVYFYWLVIFTFVGMYRTWFAASRFDELSTLFKATFVGIFILFFVIMYDDYVHNISSPNRFLIFIYWGILLLFVSAGRLFIRFFQRRLLINGIGRKNAIIVGFNSKAHNIHNTIDKHKALGFDVKAYVAVKKENVGKNYNGVAVLGTYEETEKIIESVCAKEIILALEKHEEDVLLNVISICDDKNVNLKIVPDLYEIISGQARTSQLYGFPLIDIMPQLMKEWEKKLKRLIDVMISVLFIILSAPVTILTSIAIKLESKGPIIYKQERSGLNGKVFRIYKFRSMVQDAEKKSGPMWSTKGDSRITKVGNFIRKVRIDEIPQMINILKGEMSFVGPRPERPVFVEQLAKEIPLYKRRLKVRPGLTGWAQVKHKYDESIEDVKTKLRYDLFYIENISIRMDFIIIFRTIFVVLFGKGHYN